jgi:MFS family permease
MEQVVDDRAGEPRTELTASQRPAEGARLSLGLLLSINLFNYIDRYVLAAVEPQIAQTFFPGRENTPETLAKTGSLATAFLVSYMVTAPLFGWLADRMSRWLLVGVSVGVWSLATGASGLAPTFTIMLLTRCLVGIGEAGYGPAAPTLISDMYPLSRRGQVLAWFYMAIPVGSALGFVIGGLVEQLAGWRWAFLAVMPPGLLLAVWCFFMRDPPRGKADAVEGHVARAKFRDYLPLLRNRSYVLDCLGMTAMTFAIGGISYWMPRYLTEVRGLPKSSKIIFGGIVVITGLFATLLGGIAGDRFKKRFPGSYFIVSGVAILVACPFLLLMLWVPFPWAYAALFAACFFLFFNTGPTNTILANVTHPSIRATAFAMNIFVIHALGDAVSPPLLGAIGGYNWNIAFGVVAAMMALAGVLWLWGARYLEADTAAAVKTLAG